MINKLFPAARPNYYPAINLVAVLGLIAYSICFVLNVSPYWFHPEWVTDDAFQQVYPFLKVHQPELFQGDIITEVMEGYLAPLHYWLAYLFTLITGSPILMSHALMLIQLLGCLGFFFLFIAHRLNFSAACFATIWLLSIRTVIQRMTGGLPRGWSPVLICAFLYFLSTRKHYAVLLTILCGCLLNPPATIVIAFTYGIFLFWQVISTKTRIEAWSHFVRLLILSPVFIAVTYKVVERPAAIGPMVTYQQGLQMPAMQRPDGRFPFVPLLDIPTELKLYAFDAFHSRLSGLPKDLSQALQVPHQFFKESASYFFISILVLLIVIVLSRHQHCLSAESVSYLFAIVIVYLLSRLLAFNLYVPDRHLLIPLGIFWVIATSQLIQQAFGSPITSEGRRGQVVGWMQNQHSFLFTVIFAGLIFLSNGSGLQGTANFNYHLYKKGKVFAWIKKNTPKTALIAGHPQHLDAVTLFGERQAYITYETAHPFYPRYFEECLRRSEISLKAHYAKTLAEVYNLLAPEKIDYFVFSKKRFYPDQLKQEKYFQPLATLVKELTSRDYLDYAYKFIPQQVDISRYPYLLFRDEHSVVIDVKKLGEYLRHES